MEEFKPNSYKSKENQIREKKESHIETPAQMKKKSFLDIIEEKIIAAGKYVWKNILVPSAQKMAAESIQNATNIFIYGDSRNAPRTDYRTTNIPRVSYSAPGTYWRESDMRNSGHDSYRRDYSNFTDYHNILYSSLEDAFTVLEDMKNTCARGYKGGVATIADLCDFSRYPSNYTDEHYGWTLSQLNYVEPKSFIDNDGITKYYLDLPKAMPID